MLPPPFLMMMKGQLWDSKISNLIWPAGTPRNEWQSWGFSWDREKGTPNQAELCVSQALEKTVGRGSVGGGFLDFCRRKKPPVGGRAVRGRGEGGGRAGEGPPSGRGGRDGSSSVGRLGGLCFVCAGRGWAQ